MLDSSDLQQIDKAFGRLRLVWIAMLASLGVYVLIANLLGPVFGLMPMFAEPGDPAVVKYGYGLYAIAVAELIVVYFFRRGFMRVENTRQRSSEGPYSFVSSAVQTPDLTSVQEAIGLYKNGMLLCMGVSEAIALCGFMGFIILTDYVQLYVLTAVSLAALVYVRPRRHEIVIIAEKLEELKQSTRAKGSKSSKR